MYKRQILSVVGFYMICLDAKASLASNSPFKVGVIAVSYTHLDVYKRQGISSENGGENPPRRKTKGSRVKFVSPG